MILVNQLVALTNYLNEIFNEVAKTRIPEMTGFQVFRVEDTPFRTYDYRAIHGLDVVQRVAENADLPDATTVQGDAATYTQVRYGGNVPVSKDMRMFDRYDQIGEIVRSASDDAFDKIDQSLVDVILYGFAAANYTDVYGANVTSTGPDGLAIFTASHTTPVSTATYRNLIRSGGVTNPPLTREAVVAARAEARRHLDPTGHARPIHLDTLLVGPTNEDLALRTINSSGMSGVADNDINPLRGNVNVKVWDRWDVRSDGTDTSAFWVLYDSKRVGESLAALFAERPSLDPPEQAYKSKTWNYTIDFYYAIARKFPAYIWGANGTSA